MALRRGDRDLEALETAVRAAMLASGAQALGAFMTAVGTAPAQGPVRCPHCRQPMRGTGPRTKTILTMLGEATYSRRRYVCPACDTVRYPGDEALDLLGVSRSPGVRRQAARLGAKEPFQEVAQDLRELAGVTLSRKDAERLAEGLGERIERLDQQERQALRRQEPPPPDAAKTVDTLYIEFDGTGIPMVPWEVQGRAGKQPDGSAKTREVKLGGVFTQTTVDHSGRPIRDPASTTFVGAIEDAQTFGWRIYTEAVRRDLFQAKRVVVLGDGAEWIRNLADTHFPMAQRIIDFYHAKEHVNTLCQTLFTRPDRVAHYRERWWSLLAEGRIEDIVSQAAEYLPRDPAAHKDAWRELRYLSTNKEQMRYRQFREAGLFIGSGVIEAGCRHIVGKRLKQSGMEWTVRGANAILALRCVIHSNRFQDFLDKLAA